MNNEQTSGKTAHVPSPLSDLSSDQVAGEVFDNGLLCVEHDNYCMSLAGRQLKLPRKEFLIVSCLARNFDRIVSSEEIWRYAWGDAAPFNAESLHVPIYRLRRGSVAKNILATISSGKEHATTSISSVNRNFLQHYRARLSMSVAPPCFSAMTWSTSCGKKATSA
jgi:hypothetical protein